jgi:Fur family transcriptional regulator, iron response regulator
MTMNHLRMHTAPPRSELRAVLRKSGLRPTRQRMSLAEILYAKGHRHLSAESLHAEAVARKVPVSLATIYNTLHQFTAAGLLREVAVDGSRTYFDTNTSDHHHFYVEDTDEVLDVPAGEIGVGRVPAPPTGYEISRVDVVVRLRRIAGG